MPRKSIFYIVILFLLSGGFLYAQRSVDLSVTLQDIRLVKEGTEGYHLYVRKKPAIASVMAYYFSFQYPDETFAYRGRLYNDVNGEELYIASTMRAYTGPGLFLLIDSSTEPHSEFGEAFHIFIPALLDYGFNETPSGTVWIGEQVPIDIRAFPRPYGDEDGGYDDNYFVMTYTSDETIVLASYDPNAQNAPSLTIDAWVNYTMFAPGPEGYKDNTLQINSNSSINGALSVKIPINKIWGVHTGFERDMILLNQAYVKASADFGVFGIEGGFYLGFLNFENSKIGPGLTAVLSAHSPQDVFFGSARFDLGLNRALSNHNDYTQDLMDFEAGVRFTNFILTANADFHIMTVETGRMVNSERKWTRYAISGETNFASPVAFRFDAGYQTLYWDYQTTPAWEFEYKSFFAGLGIAWKILPNLKLFLDAEAPIYPFVYPDIGDFSDPAKPFLFGASLGAAWSLR
jgi:hypothetical protein